MNYIIITSAAVVLVLLLLAQIIFSLRRKRHLILEQWDKIGHLFQEYLDRIPYLIEITKAQEIKQPIISELTQTHADFFSKKLSSKILEEHLGEFEKNITKVVKQIEEKYKIASDVHWLVIKKELHDLNHAARTAVQKYDIERDRFNQLLKIVFFIQLMGIKRISI